MVLLAVLMIEHGVLIWKLCRPQVHLYLLRIDNTDDDENLLDTGEAIDPDPFLPPVATEDQTNPDDWWCRGEPPPWERG